MQDYNRQIIDEFRANEGKVGGRFEGRTMLLLTHTGRKSGQKRTNPLVYMAEGDRLIIFASKGGAPQNPDWYWNLMSNPEATVEVGTETFEVEAEEVKGEERDRLWRKNVEINPGFGDYEQATDRVIPVVALKRK